LSKEKQERAEKRAAASLATGVRLGELNEARNLTSTVQTGEISPGFGGKTSRSFDAKTSRKNPCVETSPEAVSLFCKVSLVSLPESFSASENIFSLTPLSVAFFPPLRAGKNSSLA
jgi:hypothetical protein